MWGVACDAARGALRRGAEGSRKERGAVRLSAALLPVRCGERIGEHGGERAAS